MVITAEAYHLMRLEPNYSTFNPRSCAPLLPTSFFYCAGESIKKRAVSNAFCKRVPTVFPLFSTSVNRILTECTTSYKHLHVSENVRYELFKHTLPLTKSSQLPWKLVFCFNYISTYYVCQISYGCYTKINIDFKFSFRVRFCLYLG